MIDGQWPERFQIVFPLFRLCFIIDLADEKSDDFMLAYVSGELKINQKLLIVRCAEQMT